MTCYIATGDDFGECRSSACVTEPDCTCPAPTATATLPPGTTATNTPIPTQVIASGSTVTPTPAALPEAGLSLPGILVFGGGLLMAILGILLAL